MCVACPESNASDFFLIQKFIPEPFNSYKMWLVLWLRGLFIYAFSKLDGLTFPRNNLQIAFSFFDFTL
jgi:hypothetical protein